MQEDFRLIVDLVAVLTAAAAGGLLASLCRQPALLGYLIGGVVVGPAGLGLIKEVIQIETLAQLGVAFLLFAIGVEFSFAELKKVQGISLGGGSLQIILTILVTTFVSLVMGWCHSWAQGVFLGGILSLSSTAVVLKCLMERNEASTRQGQVMLGILVVQDLALGLMLAVLPALQEQEALGVAVAQALLKIGLFAGGAVITGIWIIPPLLRFLAKRESRELFLVGIVVLALGIALLTEYLGLSIAMGAFVAGLMISEVEYADQTLAYVEPLRDIFAALFFAAVGMLIDPVFLWENIEIIGGLVFLVVAGKFLIVAPIVKSFRYPWRTAIIAGLGLAQIGEFSFVLASLGQSMGLVSRRVYLLIVGTTAVTLVLTPFLLQLTPTLLDWAEQFPAIKRYLEPIEPLEISDNLPTSNYVVVCGYGGIGSNIVALLREHNLPVVVIEHSESKIQKLREANVSYVYGNAASVQVLEKAGVSHCRAMAIALPDSMSSRLCLKRALELSPKLDIVVRANRNKDIELLYQLGAKEVVQAQFEASLELSTHLLVGMGLPLSEIDREVAQIRSSHYQDLRPEGTKEVLRELNKAVRDLNGKWFTLPSDSPLIGMSLLQVDLRQFTGVSLMAIRRRSGEEIDYPDGEVILEADDRLLVVGEAKELLALDQLAKGELALPGMEIACQWLVLPNSSPAIGKKLTDLAFSENYGVKLQVLRRDGSLINLLDYDAELVGGDRLLLCGHPVDISKLESWLTSPEIPLLLVQHTPAIINS